MIKKLNGSDRCFGILLIIGALLISVFLFTYPYLYDEAFYTSIPYRIATGDSLIQDEWHLTQFSSVFSFLPVSIWMALKGSSEGIVVFLRFIYFLIHTMATVAIYRCFRKYEKWAVAAAMIFFTQTPYRIYCISYTSMFVLFALLLVLCLYSIYEKSSVRLYIFAGACFACCCIGNPLFCCGFALYLVACVLWKKRNTFKNFVIKIKTLIDSKTKKNTKKKSAKNNPKKNTKIIDAFPDMESYNCFFCKEAIIYASLGIAIIVAVAVTFFFATGGTVSSIFENIPNLLNSSEYDAISNELFSKLNETGYFANIISFNMPYILPLLFVVMAFDKKRKQNLHRCIYLAVSLIISVMYMVGILKEIYFEACFFSLPFVIFSIVCYMLTDKRNTRLFYCMWIPTAIAAIFQYTSANTHLASLGIVFAIGNIAGVIFVRDLFEEIKTDLNPSGKSTKKINLIAISKILLCLGLCAQFVFQGCVLMYGQLPERNSTKAAVGPYAGMIMSEQQYENYTKIIADLDLIKSYNVENEPVLIDSYKNWMYMYTDAPIAIYTTWYTGSLNKDNLIAYYKENTDKIPKYIYVDPYDFNNVYNPDNLQRSMSVIEEMFEFSQEELSNGILITVEKAKFIS